MKKRFIFALVFTMVFALAGCVLKQSEETARKNSEAENRKGFIFHSGGGTIFRRL